MLNLYQFEETWDSLKQHKNRNILTGFGVAWGIFILVLLVGAGSGLQKGIMVLFQDYTQNSMWVYGGQTSMSKPGQRAGRAVLFQNSELNHFAERFSEIEVISPEVKYSGKQLYSAKKNYRRFSCYGVNSSYFKIKTYKTELGRILNPNDEISKSRVAVIGKEIAKVLFAKDDALGNYFYLDGTWLRVVGILAEKSLFSDNGHHIYIPYPTMIAQYNYGKELDNFALALKSDTSPTKFEKEFKDYLASKYEFHSEDQNAIYIENLQADAKAFNSLFKIINGFLWLVGVCMILSGIVGVSNIMLVVVKERTQEIGIRKAIGAPPRSILYMILNESIVITFVAGIVGLISASGIVLLINAAIGGMIADKSSIFKGLEVNLPIALSALILLILSGALAGLYPAKKAASVLPIKALNSTEN
ncbi:putative ABC transport system permease protein [Ancylomarina subtilis]|uniref:Putative ABC transport system permease protein n=1 Tax=Ancylomarina subtilis TaxID=1639035 RepID=A0A4Q7VA70_9BACT|nr:ABC transporter permease [Ancylomarina subtilis]RZT92460.1 putative ABC transport system permease protein [Ancylomarina subtilis]